VKISANPLSPVVGDNGFALIFATNAQMELLSSVTQLYFDAKFKVVPTIYYQLFTLSLSPISHI